MKDLVIRCGIGVAEVAIPLTVGILLGFLIGVNSVRRDAVLNGVAKYTADTSGAARFTWNIGGER